MNRLREIRHTLGKTQAEMAELIFVDHRTYSYYERGTRRMPPARWVRLLHAVGLPPEPYPVEFNAAVVTPAQLCDMRDKLKVVKVEVDNALAVLRKLIAQYGG